MGGFSNFRNATQTEPQFVTILQSEHEKWTVSNSEILL